MNIFEIKEEYKATIVGFNHSGLPLGKRNDLHLLAKMAEYNPGLAKYFVRMPTPEEIREWEGNKYLNESGSGERRAVVSDGENPPTPMATAGKKGRKKKLDRAVTDSEGAE